MFTPHRFGTPKVPGVPHPTPNSTISYDLPNPAVHKAPIHNPYDKFTQPEFDAWIGDITGALKRALGREDAPSLSSTVKREQRSEEEEEVAENAGGSGSDRGVRSSRRRRRQRRGVCKLYGLGGDPRRWW